MLIVEGKYAAGAQACTQALNFANRFAQARDNRGVAEYHLQHYQDAMEDFDAALQVDPDDEQAYNNRGLTEQAQGDLDSALFDYNRALEIAPTYAQARTNRGWAEYHAGDWFEALRDLL